MGVLSWIVIGLIAGWLAARITNAPRGLIRNLIVGLIGSLLGGFLATKLNIQVMPDFWGELIVATAGAVIFPADLAGDPALKRALRRVRCVRK